MAGTEAEPRVRFATAVWASWWRIAEDQADQAEAEAGKVGVLGEDMQASMVAIVAAASALGGVAASIRAHSELEHLRFGKGTPPEAKIFETLKRACDLGPDADKLRSELDWLFALRDPLVHPGEPIREGISPPDRPAITGPVELLEHSAENARKAVDLVRALMRRWLEYPKPGIEQ